MNTGAPGQKSKLVESFLLLLLSLFRLPLCPPSSRPGRCKKKNLCQVALPGEAGSGAGLRGGGGGAAAAGPVPPPWKDQIFPSQENTDVKTKGNTIRPFIRPAGSGKCPRL